MYNRILLFIFVGAFGFFVWNTYRCYAKKKKKRTKEEIYESELGEID